MNTNWESCGCLVWRREESGETLESLKGAPFSATTNPCPAPLSHRSFICQEGSLYTFNEASGFALCCLFWSLHLQDVLAQNWQWGGGMAGPFKITILPLMWFKQLPESICGDGTASCTAHQSPEIQRCYTSFPNLYIQNCCGFVFYQIFCCFPCPSYGSTTALALPSHHYHMPLHLCTDLCSSITFSWDPVRLISYQWTPDLPLYHPAQNISTTP